MNTNPKHVLLGILATSALTLGSNAYSAVGDTAHYDFGLKITGAPAIPSSMNFADLDITDLGGGIWHFELSILATFNDSLPGGFGSGAKILAMMIDNDLPKGTVVPGSIGSVGILPQGVTGITTSNGGGSPFDWQFKFGTPTETLIGGEAVSWNTSGMGATFPAWGTETGGIALHVGGIGREGEGSAKFISAIPEPETYAMLLAGLGLIGFSLRRQKQ